MNVKLNKCRDVGNKCKDVGNKCKDVRKNVRVRKKTDVKPK